MLKKTIKYTDYNGTERTEDFYFNLTKAELLELELGTVGGLQNMIERMTQTQDGPAIIGLFKRIITKAYGQKSPDGRRFMKSEEISTDFLETEAYSELVMEFLSDPKFAAAFMQGILPDDMKQAVADELVKNNIDPATGKPIAAVLPPQA